jgi:hypothetical protein
MDRNPIGDTRPPTRQQPNSRYQQTNFAILDWQVRSGFDPRKRRIQARPVSHRFAAAS